MKETVRKLKKSKEPRIGTTPPPSNNLKIKRMLICKKKITWGGKVCYGKEFEIIKRRPNQVYAQCIKCGELYDVQSI
jgi:hypothetical protein